MKKQLPLRIALLLIVDILLTPTILANSSALPLDLEHSTPSEQKLWENSSHAQENPKTEHIPHSSNDWDTSSSQEEKTWIPDDQTPPQSNPIPLWDTSKLEPLDSQDTENLWENNIHLIPTPLDTPQDNAQNDPNPSLPKLFITEFFFQGRNDYFEIYNDGEDFEGNLELIFSDQKNTKKIPLNTISLPAQSSLVVAQTPTIFKDLNVKKLNLGISISSDLRIELHSDDQLIDSFFLTKADANTIKNKNISFEKIRENWQYNIRATTNTRTINLQSGFIGNPGLAFEQIDQLPPQENNQYDTPKSPQSKGNLVLTEVFFHKTNSWFEISNIGDQDYQWPLSLKGIHKTKELSYDLTIPAHSSIIIAKNKSFLEEEKLTMLLAPENYYVNRKEPLHITLKTDNDREDHLIVHQDRMKKKSNTEANEGSSFEKILIDDQRVTTRTSPERRRNIRGTFDANPGFYYDQQNFPQEVENIKDVSQAVKGKEEENIENTHQLCKNFTDRYRIEVQEIFGGNEQYPAFIELKLTDHSGNYKQLRFWGTLLTKPFTIEADEWLGEKGENFLITQQHAQGFEGIDNFTSPDFNLWNHSWNLIVEWRDGQWRQVVDILAVETIHTNRSLYPSGTTKEGCLRVFALYGDFSPGFDKKFLDFFKIDSKPKIEYVYVGGGGSCNCPTQADLCPLSNTKNNQKTQTSNHDTIPSSWTTLSILSGTYQVKIEHLIYDPPGADKNHESITLILTEGNSLDLQHTTLLVQGKKKKLTGTLVQGESQTFFGNFGFPNSSKDDQTIAVQLLLWDQILDTYYYTFPPKTSPKDKSLPPQEGYKVFSVLDGDTFRYRDEEGKLQSVRLLWVDSPESNTARYKKVECYGKEAKEQLSNLIKNKYVKLVFDPSQANSDHYGRYLAYVYLDDLLINEEMIKSWFAREYTYKIPYSLQHQFKTREQEAKNAQLGMRNPTSCPDSLEQEQVHQDHINNLIIKITDIKYNPPGKDQGNESITLSVYDKSGKLQSIDFGNQFWIFVVDAENDNHIDLSALSYEKGKFQDISFLWEQTLNKTMLLQGDFKLPNNKSSCIALVQREHLFDIACYQLKKTHQEQNTQLPPTQFLGTIKIQSLLPNPLGKDSNKEEIQLLYQGEEAKIDLEHFHLLINGKNKKKLSGELLQNQSQTLIWNFWFPNSYACVSLHFQEQLLDTFCYHKEKEGTKFWIDNTPLSSLSVQEFQLLKQIKLRKYPQSYCIEYQGEKLECRKTAKYKPDPQLQLRSIALNSALTTLEELLREKYSPLYYQSELVDFFTLLKKVKTALKNGEQTIIIGTQTHSIKNFQSLYQNYTNPLWTQGIELLDSLISPHIKTLFISKKEQRIAHQYGEKKHN